MTADEWERSENPAAMLDALRKDRECIVPLGVPGTFKPFSDRKARLFACACCRMVWDRLTDERSRRAVEVSERYADGLASEEEREQAFQEAREVIRFEPLHRDDTAKAALYEACDCAASDVQTAMHTITAAKPMAVPPATQAALLRSIVNPFALPLPREPKRCERCKGKKTIRVPIKALGLMKTDCPECGGAGTVAGECVWLTPTALALAEAAYQHRLSHPCGNCNECLSGAGGKCCHEVQTGQLDPDRLSVLADALEDAGCTDESYLMPLRGFMRCNDASCPDSPMNLDKDGVFRGPYRYAKCKCGGGWVRDETPRFPGFWVIDALLGRG